MLYQTTKHQQDSNIRNKMDRMMNCRNNLKQKMLKIIHNDLTIRRTNNNLTQFTDDELKRFIRFYSNDIDDAITRIISYYQQDGDTFFEYIENVELNMISQYLYFYIRELYELNQLIGVNGIIIRRGI
jgi:DNA replicative helicase MCM subunit Mcm2 (Cdc46/Mcm family)